MRFCKMICLILSLCAILNICIFSVSAEGKYKISFSDTEITEGKQLDSRNQIAYGSSLRSAEYDKLTVTVISSKEELDSFYGLCHDSFITETSEKYNDRTFNGLTLICLSVKASSSVSYYVSSLLVTNDNKLAINTVRMSPVKINSDTRDFTIVFYVEKEYIKNVSQLIVTSKTRTTPDPLAGEPVDFKVAHYSYTDLPRCFDADEKPGSLLLTSLENLEKYFISIDKSPFAPYDENYFKDKALILFTDYNRTFTYTSLVSLVKTSNGTLALNYNVSVQDGLSVFPVCGVYGFINYILEINKKDIEGLSPAAPVEIHRLPIGPETYYNENMRPKNIVFDEKAFEFLPYEFMLKYGEPISSYEILIENKAVFYDREGKMITDYSKHLSTGDKVLVNDADGINIFAQTVLLPGDVDGDAVVTAKDARLALRASAELEKLSDISTHAAITCGGKTLSAQDARKILRFSAGLEKELYCSGIDYF